ncbi:MAG TPA: universal stress protein [Draconibacterium sp.]|nr:universal stress protein [Draconibacterium sp.]
MENQLVTILRITTPHLGSFVKNKFEEHKIEVFFTNEGLRPGEHYNPDEVLLKVKAKQSEKAIATLLQIHKDFDLYKIKEDPDYNTKKRILVPIKLSENCIQLCKYAIGLAQKQNAEIKLLYVYPDPSFNESKRNTASWSRIVKMELKEAHQKAQLKLVNFSNELKEQVAPEIYNSVKLHYRMLKGTPVNVINEACKRYNPDVILMGTKTSKKAGGEFLGTTLIKVIDQTSFPVLAVPLSTDFKGKDHINVMYATDFYQSDMSSLNKLLEILESYNKNIYCIHIDLNNDPKLEDKVNELNAMLKSEYSEHQIRCELFESSNIVKGFNDFVKQKEIDIISLSKQKRSAFYKLFHQDLIATLIKAVKIPILIFPVK